MSKKKPAKMASVRELYKLLEPRAKAYNEALKAAQRETLEAEKKQEPRG